MSYPVESGIPMPRPQHPRDRYPWKQLEPGQSFFVPEAEDERARDRLKSAISYAGRRNGRKFAIRKMDGGFRVWRLT